MRILHSLLFFPRGGSAFVARALARQAVDRGHEVLVVAGSLGRPGEFSHAGTFYSGLNIQAMAYDGARDSFLAGGDPLRHARPFHPSYERRSHAPDRLFSEVSPRLAQWSRHRWTEFYRDVRSNFRPDVLHLHHLTPQAFAACSVFQGTPILSHLHGTELKHLEWLLGSRPAAGNRNYRGYWVRYLRAAAKVAQHTVTVSPADQVKAGSLLKLPGHRTEAIPNGVDLSLFRPRRRSAAVLTGQLTRFLTTDAQGWDESGAPGSLRYPAEQARRLAGLRAQGRPLLLFVGRFTAVKRLTLLLAAIGRLHAGGLRVCLLVWGGFPGEWEGEHPCRTVARLGLSDVYFLGWRGHEDLAGFLPQADALVLPSSDESFGQVLLEAMACGVPVVAANRGGPPTFVNQDNGWCFAADDLDSLTATLREVLTSPAEQSSRGRRARHDASTRFGWPVVFDRFAHVYKRLTDLPGS